MMKPLFKKATAWAIGLGIFLAVTHQVHADTEKNIDRSFNLKGNTEIVLENKFGKIHIDTWNKQVCQVQVKITAKGSNESRNKDLLDRIEIEFDDAINSGSLEVRTVVNNLKNNNNSFSIDYTVRMPNDKKLELHNSFGDVYLPDYSGSVDMTVKYGNLRAGNITGNLDLYLAFGKAESVMGNLVNADIEVKYSKLECGNIRLLDLQSQFSDFSAESVQNIDIESKYGSLILESVERIEGEMAFSGLRIGKLKEAFDLEVKYGDGMVIEHISPGFDVINLECSFSKFELNLDPELDSHIKADIRFGNLKTSGDRFNFNIVKKEHTSSYYEGWFGGENTRSKIIINSKYGDVKLYQN